MNNLVLYCSGAPYAPWAVAVIANRRNGSDLFKIQAWSTSGPPESVFITGIMGPVMTTSICVALACVRLNWERLVTVLMPAASQDDKLKATRSLFETPLHLHNSAAGEGPSAGLAVFLTVAGFVTGRECRDDTVVTGQLTVGGRVLKVGGCLEKGRVVLNKGRQRFVLPFQNAGELDTLEATKGIEVHAVRDIWEALPLVLVPSPLAAPEQPDPHAPGQDAGWSNTKRPGVCRVI